MMMVVVLDHSGLLELLPDLCQQHGAMLAETLLDGGNENDEGRMMRE